MKNIFNQLGFHVSDDREFDNQDEIEVLFINNPDGTMRWFWPSYLEKPLFLKFYNVSNLRSFIYSTLIRVVFVFKLQSMVFRRKLVYVSKFMSANTNFSIHGEWSAFKGTVGPNNKSIVYFENCLNNSFIKIANTQNAKNLLEKEANILNRLFVSGIQMFRFPEVVEAKENFLQLTDISDKGKRVTKITDSHTNALIELNEISSIHMPLSESDTWLSIKQNANNLKHTSDLRMPKGLIKKLNITLDEIDENEETEVCLSHGDFTPWNMYFKDGQLHIYDWELAEANKPLGFDLFHFIVQQGVLVDHKSWVEIQNDIYQHINSHSFSRLSKFNVTNVEKYLKLYFVYNITQNLSLLSKQAVWHTQAYWLINLWNEALSSMLTKSVSERELVIMDTFDFLLNKNYAAMKFPNMSPEKLSVYSDIDLFIDKDIKSDLSKYYSTHPLVKKISDINKSFMSSLQLIVASGSILNLDLIWQVKRKGLEILDADSILKNAYTNGFGVKMMDTYDNARYIGLFYALNNAAIPLKFQYYEELLRFSNKSLDVQLYPRFLGGVTNNGYLKSFVKSQACNKKLSGIINKANYLIDSVRTVLFNQGIIITFSGVDGSGKSTVISHVKYLVEKQLRKRVVVLRHRPSILPILSAWTKGKAKAEMDTTQRLPRTGNNNNLLSSLARFAYYFTDYVIGQFLVHVKYVWKGYVVIYDRYYFDFISDSKRSNIVLPKPILKAGFNFIMKPRFNFFLYADAETILQRKNELDKTTVDHLNSEYLNQFEKLSHKGSHSKYVSIKNINLDDTLNQIFGEISFNAA
jgi:thymidylate kinase